ncbi:ABC transporter ATP-binding protein [Phytohabitans suffuscus]|uniref:ABC-type quaternary amine transporter n=1 Tax=Phytohabitans suffuscus TaxID=624315 RepID=A0A6F8YEL5_9ACTN|nr:ABC transporter ATP-binding protein [Phytohabitans suffuscus]BCB84542.1 Fe3+/spermidine/putrescine ABC transporter ATP-binding protein [Phytohabitans suffuscus]
MVQHDANHPPVRLRNVTKTFRRHGGATVRAVDDVSLDIAAGEFVVLLGPSGCGKTTLLRCIAGLENPDQGRIEINGVCVFDADKGILVPPERRQLAMMFQSYALWPHMTARQNVEYVVRGRGTSKRAAHDISDESLGMARVGDLADQYPAQLSGGQQQRVALARSLATRRRVVLFDEPLSNVDAQVREQLREELRALQRQRGFAAVYVTHDQVEAMQLADRVAVMRSGEVCQVGSAQQIYDQPDSAYVAGFVGQSNDLRGVVTEIRGGQVCVDTDLGNVWVDRPSRLPLTDLAAADNVQLIIRPEAVALSTSPHPSPNTWKGEAAATMFTGSHVEYRVAVGEARIACWSANRAMITEGTSVWLTIRPDDIHLFKVV